MWATEVYALHMNSLKLLFTFTHLHVRIEFYSKVTFEQLPSSEASRSETKVWCGIVSKWKTDNTCCTPFESMATVETGIVSMKLRLVCELNNYLWLYARFIGNLPMGSRKFRASRFVVDHISLFQYFPVVFWGLMSCEIR